MQIFTQTSTIDDYYLPQELYCRTFKNAGKEDYDPKLHSKHQTRNALSYTYSDGNVLVTHWLAES